MKKQDLKFKNVVELRNGYKLFYHQFCEEDLLDFDGNGCIQLIDFDENLNHLYSSNYDIVKVYEDYTCTKILWERISKIILTKEEVRKLEALKELGFNYIARDENNCLWAYDDEPCKYNSCWTSYTTVYKLAENLFPFIKWEDEEPYSIEELLNE